MAKLIILMITIYFSILTGQAQVTGTFTDSRDGRIYKTVKIGTQTWMAENLDAAVFRNGDPIPQASTKAEWESAANNKQAAWCYYNNPVYEKTYGKLYNFYAVSDPRGLAPEGWHVPSDSEWTMLVTYLGGDSLAAIKLKEKDTIHWASPNAGANNSTCFTALPGGLRSYNGTFYYLGCYGCWWSSTEDLYAAWYRGLFYYNSTVARLTLSNIYSLSVRCIKD
jgi:uncharacterized protein (TIGR02145 family)